LVKPEVFLATLTTGVATISAAFLLLRGAKNGKVDGWMIGCVACVAAFAGFMLYLTFAGGPMSPNP
jgi:hypothetical protein